MSKSDIYKNNLCKMVEDQMPIDLFDVGCECWLDGRNVVEIIKWDESKTFADIKSHTFNRTLSNIHKSRLTKI